jgi:hypothetical protein
MVRSGLLRQFSHWFDYVYFSIVTFTSLGYGDIHPALPAKWLPPPRSWRAL